MDIRVVVRETVTTEPVECIERVAIKATRTPAKGLDFVFVLRDEAGTYGVLDAFGVCYPYTNADEVVWFGDAKNVEETIEAFAKQITQYEGECEALFKEDK